MSLLWTTTVIMTVVFQLTPSRIFVGSIHDVFCTSETLNASCSSGHVVVIRRALYGRLSASRCITSEYTHALGCYADVTSHVIDACSGADWRQNCTLLVATVDAIAQPCGKDFKSYLDIEYDCIPASYSDDCTHGNYTILTEPDGYIALFARPPESKASTIHGSTATALSGKTCPWILVAEVGKRFNVSWRLPATSLSFGAQLIHANHLQDVLDAVDEDDNAGNHRTVSSHSSPADRDSSDVNPLLSSAPVLTSAALCTATWKIIDSDGESSQFAACSSDVDVRTVSSSDRSSLAATFDENIDSDNSNHVLRSAGTQPAHADRIYHSTSNRIEIQFTGSMEALAFAEGSQGQNDDQRRIRLPGESDEEGRKVIASRLLHTPLAVLHYTVIGCTDIIPPEGAFVSRHIDSAAIICNQSAETWYVTCRDGRWSGHVGNCSGFPGESASTKPTAMSRLQLRFENGVIVAILIGITLGTIAGAVLLGIVFNINRKSNRKHNSVISVRRSKLCKEPYASVSVGTGASDIIKQVTGRLDDVIYPTLLLDDYTSNHLNSSTCHDCACAAAAFHRCGVPSSSGSHVSLIGVNVVSSLPPPPPPPTSAQSSTISGCRPCPVPVVPPPLLHIVRPPAPQSPGTAPTSLEKNRRVVPCRHSHDDSSFSLTNDHWHIQLFPVSSDKVNDTVDVTSEGNTTANIASDPMRFRITGYHAELKKHGSVVPSLKTTDCIEKLSLAVDDLPVCSTD